MGKEQASLNFPKPEIIRGSRRQRPQSMYQSGWPHNWERFWVFLAPRSNWEAIMAERAV